MKRRPFLQSAAATLGTLGLSQLDFLAQADRHAKVLATGTPRKLALLVGINAYPAGIPTLRGCLTDVEMQYELLVHRFGFQPSDILILATQKLPFMNQAPLQPTRQNILDGFEHHLIAQAKPGDVVVFHFSGHGSQVEDPDAADPSQINSNKKPVSGTLVPADRTDADGNVQDIMGRTLFLLTTALATDNVTLVLDSCNSGGATRNSGYTVRAAESLPNGQLAPIHPLEQEYQQRWIRDYHLEPKTVQLLRRSNIAKGAAIASTLYNQSAVDASFDDGRFYAGAFSYLLTRYLWQAIGDSSMNTTSAQLIRSTQDLAARSGIEQIPTFAANPKSNLSKPMYFLPSSPAWADAVVQQVGPKGEVEYWLGGVSELSLVAHQSQSSWTAISPSGQALGEVTQVSRSGLQATGKFTGKSNQIKPGTLLRERIRNIPNDFKLRLGLDESLGEDVPGVAQFLVGHRTIKQVPIGQADYFLGRCNDQIQAHSAATKSLALGSVGLFQMGLVPLEATFDRSGESGGAAIERLQGALKSLLAGQLLKLMTGTDLLTGGKATGLTATVVQPGQVTPKQVTVGLPLQVRVQNQDPNRDLYVAVLVINGSGTILPIYPYGDAEGNTLLEHGQTLETPKESDGFQFIAKAAGTVEVLVLASAQPIREALVALKSIAISRDGRRDGVSPEQTLQVMGKLLKNLDQNTREGRELPIGVSSVDTHQITAISIPLSIVAASVKTVMMKGS